MTIGCCKVHLAIAICLMCLTHRNMLERDTSSSFTYISTSIPCSTRNMKKQNQDLLEHAFSLQKGNSLRHGELKMLQDFEGNIRQTIWKHIVIIGLLSCVTTHFLLLIIYQPVCWSSSSSSSTCTDQYFDVINTPTKPTDRQPFFTKKNENLPGTDYSGTKLLKGFFGPDWW